MAVQSSLQTAVNQWFDTHPNATPQQVFDAIQANGGLTPEGAQAIANRLGITPQAVQSSYTAFTPAVAPKVNPVDALTNFVNTTNDPQQVANKIQQLGGLTPDLSNVLVQKFGSNPTSVQTAYNELITPGSLKRNANFLTKPNPRGFVIGDPAGFDIGQVASIALAIAFPGAGAALASELGVSEIVGKAIINAAISVASGQPIETAIQNSTINAVTQTGSTSVAKDIYDTVGQVGAEAIAGAGGSIAATLAKGGTVDDAVRNATGSIVAAGVKSEFGATAGAAAGGAITGGATGAVTGAAGQLFGGTKKPAPTEDTNISGYVPPVVGPAVQVAGIEGFTPPEGATVTDSGPNRLFVEIANPSNPNDKRAYEVVKDPVTGEISYEMGVGDPTKFEDVSIVSSKTRPTFFFDIPASSNVASFQQSKSKAQEGGGKTPSDTTTGGTPGGVSGPGGVTGDTPGGPGDVSGPGGPGSVSGSGGPGDVKSPGGPGGPGGLGGPGGPGGISPDGPGDGLGDGSGVGPGGTVSPPVDRTQDPTITTDPTIYSGQSAKASTRILYPTLSGFGTSPLQQSLAAYKPPGEVEGEATGKPRQNVWNEASLRLKDALGI